MIQREVCRVLRRVYATPWPWVRCVPLRDAETYELRLYTAAVPHSIYCILRDTRDVRRWRR